jgi:hypothetical protein
MSTAGGGTHCLVRQNNSDNVCRNGNNGVPELDTRTGPWVNTRGMSRLQAERLARELHHSVEYRVRSTL